MGNSPYKCTKCGAPANSPMYKTYCWDCYDKYTDGKVFE
jgi:NMD protein affecting ribosome stability and mRNA decay